MEHPSAAKQALAVFALLAVTAIWGSTFILVKWTIEDIGIYYFLFIRFALASAVLLAIFHGRMRRIGKDTIKAALVLGLLMFTAYASQTEGLRFTTASNSALITGLYMVLVPFFSFAYQRTRPDPLALVGIALAIPGLFLLTQYSFTGINAGDLITLVCTFACAWHIIFTGKFAAGHSLIPLVVTQFLFVTLLSGGVALAKGEFTVRISQMAWFTIVLTSIFATAIAFTVQIAAQRVLDPTRAGIVLAMEAVFGTLFGYLLGGELMTTLSLVGACLMVGGMFLSEMRSLARFAIDKIVG